MDQEAQKLAELCPMDEDSLSLLNITQQDIEEIITLVFLAEVLSPYLFQDGNLISFADEEAEIRQIRAKIQLVRRWRRCSSEVKLNIDLNRPN